MSSLYEDFLTSVGDWRNSMVYKCIKSTTRNGRRGIRRWLTRTQLNAHFTDPKIVDAIIVRKETDDYLAKTEIRDHPDCPGLTQYLVLVDEEHTDEDMDEITAKKDKKEKRGKDKNGKKPKKDPKNKRSKKNKGKNNKNNNKNDETEQQQAEKERIKKVISNLSRLIRETNNKMADIADLSTNVQAALKKDLDDCIARLTASRAELQSAVDSSEELFFRSSIWVAMELKAGVLHTSYRSFP
ncbi:unnamed protein product [Symbiodinium necroappetens]|uniref:Uncharacterized protein n=1 Tax=Symbiodinium necroappetens TaxID=1628268 RepID=A0A812WP75_9DINO|nr:unnamed protein product [Symbiodinium necroappetens]